MTGYLKRLLASSAAYQAPSVLSAGLAIVTVRVYTEHLSKAQYGYAETLLTFVIFTSILLRAGMGEAFVRYWADDADRERQLALARTAVAFVAITSTVASLLGVVFAGPLSVLLLKDEDATLMAFGLVGLWAFTNLEIAYALLRVEERRREFAIAGISNVLLTITLSMVLVVGFDAGARGYVAGNYLSSALVLLGLWWHNRDRVSYRVQQALMPLVRFGAPTIPADATVFLLNVIDRAYLLRAQSAATAGVYALAVKVSTAIIVVARGFQAAWPPLAYSVTDDEEAARLYAFVTTLYVLFTGVGVAAITLLARWMVRVFGAPAYFEAYKAVPWLALGWALYGLVQLFITIAGRAKVTTRNFPAALAGVIVNTVVLIVLVDPLGIAGAGIALCSAYVVMLAVLHVLTRDLFAVPFEYGRLTFAVGLLTAVAVGGELLLPTHGLSGLASRCAILLLIPAGLLAGGFFTPEERARLARLRPGNRR